MSMSVDGFVAGPDQSTSDPLGIGGEGLHTWLFDDAGRTADDDRFVALADEAIGATVMGRNMFGPVRGQWGDDEWRGWWGDDPPFHHPVVVLTHHAHDPIEMDGGTTFSFVTDGIEAALERAVAQADGQDVRLGGGASTVRQYLAAGLVDEMHVAIVPILLGAGERLFDDSLASALCDFECVEHVASPSVTHVRFARRSG